MRAIQLLSLGFLLALGSCVFGQDRQLETARRFDWRIDTPTDGKLAKIKAIRSILGDSKDWIKYLGYCLLHPDEKVRCEAIDALAAIGSPLTVHAVTEVTRALRSSNDHIRKQAIEILRGIGPPAAEAVLDLVAILDDSNPHVRTRAAYAIGTIRGQPKYAVPALAKALKDPDRTNIIPVRNAAAINLGYFGPDAADSIPALVAELHDAELQFAWNIIESLGRIKSRPKDVVPVLSGILFDQRKADTHAAAAAALVGYGADAKDAIPSLFQAYGCAGVDSGKARLRIRTEVLRALAAADPHGEKAFSFLSSVAQGPEATTQEKGEAVHAMGLLNGKKKEAAAFLVGAMNDPPILIAYSRQLELALLGLERDAVQSLVANLRTAKDANRSLTIRVLGQIGPAAQEAVPYLEAELGNEETQTAAAAALSNILRRRVRAPR